MSGLSEKIKVNIEEFFSFFSVKFSIAGLFFLILFSLQFSGISIFSQSPQTAHMVYFDFNSVRLKEVAKVKLRQFLKSNLKTGGYLLLQGSGCDRGGYDISLSFATRRAKNVNLFLISENIEKEKIFTTGGIVRYDLPRASHRRVSISIFANRNEIKSASAGVNRISDYRTDGEKVSAESFAALNYFIILAVLLTIIIIVVIFIRIRKRQFEKHFITPQESAMLSAITGGEVTPLSSKEITKELKGSGSRIMGKKKVVKKHPISIKSAVDKKYEEKSLSIIAKSPVDALQGISPRHARLLKEGFGINTVEDLAKLKYFEIAKAIVVLSKYEK